MDTASSVRIDKWLWAVRLFKTRSLAVAACSAGKVKISDHPVKPAREVRVGEIIVATVGDITRTVKVLGVIEQRVGAKLVPGLMEDLTPPEEFTKQQERARQPVFFRPKGSGRPTKKDRRTMDGFFGNG